MGLQKSSPLLGPSEAYSYVDGRLHQLRVDYWTRIPISNEFAARVISSYLQVDHALLGFFDADLFVADLVAQQLRYCSAVLVSSLLFYACVCDIT
jgi:hypothetical protein